MIHLRSSTDGNVHWEFERQLMEDNYKNRLEQSRINIDKEISRMKSRLEKLYSQKERVEEKIRRVDNPREISICVVSSMNAGKSTFVNALLQQKLMPVTNQACTNKLIKVVNDDTIEYSVRAFNESDRVVDQSSTTTYEKLLKLKADDSVTHIELTGSIPFAKNAESKISVIDTGSLHSGRSTNKDTFKVMKSDGNIIVYVLNAPQLETFEDILLKFIADDPSMLRRTVFVANKLDCFNPREENIEKFYMDAKEYLLSMGISTKDIYPISALTALNIRTILNKSELDMDDDEIYDAMGKVRKFNINTELHLEKYALVSEEIKAKIDLELKTAETNGDRNKQALIHSGIPTVEARLVELANELANK